MGIMLYWHKRNFETQKAERFFKERRIPYQSVDLNRHRLGQREVEAFVRGASARGILDLDDIKVKSHPVAYSNQDSSVIDYVVENPRLLRSPIIRSGAQIIVGFDQKRVEALLINQREEGG